jgi:hypothetical protein
MVNWFCLYLDFPSRDPFAHTLLYLILFSLILSEMHSHCFPQQ